MLLAGLLGLGLLTGCGNSTRNYSDSAIGPGPGAPPVMREQGPATPAPGGGNGSTDAPVDRKEVVTGSVDITTSDPIGAAAKVADQVHAVDGRIDSRSEQPGTDSVKAHATLTVRVPTDKTDAFLAGLKADGRVTTVTTNREDVTMQWQDLDARIKALQASVDRLRALVSSAASTADLIAAENALSGRQGDLDSLTARKRHLDEQIALSTLTIELSTDEPPGSQPDSYGDRVVKGWHSLMAALKATGNALPWIVFLLIVAGVVWGVRRAVRWRFRGRTGPEFATPGRTAEGASEEPSGRAVPDAPGSAESGSGEPESEAEHVESAAGQPVAVDAVAGQPVAREPSAGLPAVGEPAAGQQSSGEPAAGQQPSGKSAAEGERVESAEE